MHPVFVSQPYGTRVIHGQTPSSLVDTRIGRAGLDVAWVAQASTASSTHEHDLSCPAFVFSRSSYRVCHYRSGFIFCPSHRTGEFIDSTKFRLDRGIVDDKLFFRSCASKKLVGVHASTIRSWFEE